MLVRQHGYQRQREAGTKPQTTSTIVLTLPLALVFRTAGHERDGTERLMCATHVTRSSTNSARPCMTPSRTLAFRKGRVSASVMSSCLISADVVGCPAIMRSKSAPTTIFRATIFDRRSHSGRVEGRDARPHEAHGRPSPASHGAGRRGWRRSSRHRCRPCRTASRVGQDKLCHRRRRDPKAGLPSRPPRSRTLSRTS